MEIDMKKNGRELTVALEGRLDTLTSPELEDRLGSALDDVDRLIFELSGLNYISSAGLRVLLGALQVMEDRDGMAIRNVTPPVMDVFEITGMTEELDIR